MDSPMSTKNTLTFLIVIHNYERSRNTRRIHRPTA